MLPRIVPSCGVIGTTDGDLLGAEIPIAGIAGDQQSALFGQACFKPGLSKNTYGTGCFLLLNTGKERATSKNGLLSTTAASEDAETRYALEGSIFVGGAVIQWLRDEMRMIYSASESEALAKKVPDTAGVYLVPAFVGLGAPHWDAEARGVISGLTRGATREHIVRAALESIAYQTRELVEAMEADSESEMTELRADGGASANDFLMQFQADILGKPVVRPTNLETTAAGAAYLAGLATGFWSDTDELEQFWKADRVFEPNMPAERREELFGGWKKAVEKARL
jgi:glycerol kinase